MAKHEVPDVQALFSQSGLSVAAMDYLASRFRLFQFNQGVKIIEKGKRGQFLAVVAQGQVDVQEGNGAPRTLKKGEKFGEEMILIGAPSLITATTRTRTQLWVLTRKDFLAAEQIKAVLIPAKSKRARRNLFIPVLILIAALIAGLLFLYPELPNAAHYYVTRTLLDAGRSDLAEQYLRVASRIQPGSAQVFDELGYTLYLQGKYPQALESFDRAVQLDPDSASAQNNLGVLLIGMSRPEQAIEHLKLAKELDPGNGEIYFNLGNAYLATGDRAAALSAYRRAVDMNPAQIDAKSQIAGLLLEQGQLAESKQLWDEILKLQPENRQALRGLGIIAVTDKKYQDGFNLLQKVTTADPADASGHFYLGLAFEGLQMFDEAAKQFELVRLLTADPLLLEQAKAHLDKYSP
jgi:tetratricopeptide (TPR) repeat protein